MDDDEYGDADDILVALAAQSEPSKPAQSPAAPRIQQPTPQRLDRAPPSNPASSSATPKVVQPTPQALPARGSGSSILVSPRQKGNPVLACLKSVAWEYSDILADYGLGQTTCALYLRPQYHRLHPEYIYTRVRNLQGKYKLRIVLTMVDIPNHEDALRELSKTSLVHNVTIILAWSAAEAARYLELYKSYEHAGFGAIRGQQASSYAERLVDFVTAPRNINKTDAVALVSSFGSLRNAVNAQPDQLGVVGGWGEKKVRAWTKAVEEPFRVKKAGRRAGTTGKASQSVSVSVSSKEQGEDTEAEAAIAEAEGGAEVATDSGRRLQPVPVRPASATSATSAVPARKADQLSDGVAAALAKLREKG